MNRLLELKHEWQPQFHFGKYDDDPQSASMLLENYNETTDVMVIS